MGSCWCVCNHHHHLTFIGKDPPQTWRELMVLGFISLILVFSQYYIAEICIPTKVANTMWPCKKEKLSETGDNRRRLLWYEHRMLASKESKCKEEDGKVPIITVDGLHQLHILIFFLAVLHVLYSAVTMGLGRLKIRGWKQWEQETESHDYEFSNVSSISLAGVSITPFILRLEVLEKKGCFFRQFFRSVSRSDYLTLRNGFISVHLAPGSKFNFQKYIKRSLEDDYKTVVGVSPVLWASFVVFLLLNVSGWQALFWAALIPLFIILAVGTKLQAILTKMALEITERHAVVQGIPLVQGSDKYFWFGRPHLMLNLIHFALFQYEFGINSCFHDNLKVVIGKIALGVGVLLLCSYITLPLYALVAQMGSHMKKSIFDEHTSKALKKWHNAVKKRTGKGGKSPARALGGGSPTASMSSTLHSAGATLHRFKTTGHSTRSFTYETDPEQSDYEEPHSPTSSATTNLIVRVDNNVSEIEPSAPNGVDENRNVDDFSFVKPAPLK
ncbi:hypothetical protein RHMOL_Rhmol10G0281100 [Rhododendron molle]|uniref:Uncharacterized protein n=1 Tax=Rhododendron molle TaxID=49168 RepID=A0ACC0M856_RHOML|nr:hypothetical protein RHMOL_Rhmol10G0281100 [Rhododendron molle]